MIRPLFAVLIPLLISSGLAPARAQTAPIIPPGAEAASFVGGDYDSRIDPAPVLEVAKAIARASNRRVLLEVGGDWCSWCQVLDRHVAADPGLQQAMAGSFVVMKVFWGFENQNKKLLGGFPKAPGYPHFYVLDGDGQLLHSQPTDVFETGDAYDSAKLADFARAWDQPR